MLKLGLKAGLAGEWQGPKHPIQDLHQQDARTGGLARTQGQAHHQAAGAPRWPKSLLALGLPKRRSNSWCLSQLPCKFFFSPQLWTCTKNVLKTQDTLFFVLLGCVCPVSSDCFEEPLMPLTWVLAFVFVSKVSHSGSWHPSCSQFIPILFSVGLTSEFPKWASLKEK